jgi:hypothetical protein
MLCKDVALLSGYSSSFPSVSREWWERRKMWGKRLYTKMNAEKKSDEC